MSVPFNVINPGKKYLTKYIIFRFLAVKNYVPTVMNGMYVTSKAIAL